MRPQRKWIKGVASDARLSTAARKVVAARLATVAHWLPLAAREADRDVEYVHQLRVSTRRAMAALDGFSDLLPPRRGKRLADRLRRVRRAAGQARDLDVLLIRLAEREASHPHLGWSLLRSRLEALRHAAQRPIVRIHRRLRRWNLTRRVDRVVRRIRWRGPGDEPDFGPEARRRLARAAEVFFAAGAADLGQVAELHQFRIRGKQLRYAMEIFAPGFPGELRDELYPLLADVQERLGQVNDHAVALDHFTAVRQHFPDPRLDAPCQELLDEESAALEAACRAFLDWWTPDRARELRAHFDRLLIGAREEGAA